MLFIYLFANKPPQVCLTPGDIKFHMMKNQTNAFFLDLRLYVTYPLQFSCLWMRLPDGCRSVLAPSCAGHMVFNLLIAFIMMQIFGVRHPSCPIGQDNKSASSKAILFNIRLVILLRCEFSVKFGQSKYQYANDARPSHRSRMFLINPSSSPAFGASRFLEPIKPNSYTTGGLQKSIDLKISQLPWVEKLTFMLSDDLHRIWPWLCLYTDSKKEWFSWVSKKSNRPFLMMKSTFDAGDLGAHTVPLEETVSKYDRIALGQQLPVGGFYGSWRASCL